MGGAQGTPRSANRKTPAWPGYLAAAEAGLDRRMTSLCCAGALGAGLLCRTADRPARLRKALPGLGPACPDEHQHRPHGLWLP